MAALTPEQAVRTLLMSASNVTNIVATRVYPETDVPQRAVYPYGTHSVVSRTHAHHLDSTSGMARMRLQLNWYTEGYDSAVSLAETARLALDGFKGTVTSGADSLVISTLRLDSDGIDQIEADDADQEVIHRVYQDYFIWSPVAIATF